MISACESPLFIQANLNIHLFVYIQKYLLKAFHVSDTVTSAKVTSVNKVDSVSTLLELTFMHLLMNVKLIKS